MPDEWTVTEELDDGSFVLLEYPKCVFNMIGPRYVEDRYANVKYKTAAWHAEALQ